MLSSKYGETTAKLKLTMSLNVTAAIYVKGTFLKKTHTIV